MSHEFTYINLREICRDSSKERERERQRLEDLLKPEAANWEIRKEKKKAIMKKRRRSDRSVYVLCVCTLLCAYTHVNVHIRVQDLTAGCVFRKGGQQHEVSGHRGAVLTVSLQASAHTQTLWMIAVAHPGESLFLNTQPSFTLPSARLISLGHRPSPNIRRYHILSASFKGTVHPEIKCIYFTTGLECCLSI